MTLRGIISVLLNLALLALSGCPLSTERAEAPLPEVGGGTRRVPVVLLIDGNIEWHEGVRIALPATSSREVVVVVMDAKAGTQPLIRMGRAGITEAATPRTADREGQLTREKFPADSAG